MSVIGKIDRILETVCDEVAKDVYEGKSDTYIVYNVAAEDPTGYHDDAPSDNIIYLQIHLYMPKDDDYTLLQKELKTAVFNGGFSYPRVALNTVEKDTDKRHICYETNIAESEE